MTRVTPAGMLKGRRQKPLRPLPKKGTAIRALYDKLLAARGGGVTLNKKEAYVMTPKLTDFYGCDIRWVGRKTYAMVGEDVENNYVDYVAASNCRVRDNRVDQDRPSTGDYAVSNPTLQSSSL